MIPEDWKEIATKDLPPIGEIVLLYDKHHHDLVIATHKLDKTAQPPETYWDVWADQQYAIYEKWTHYTRVILP